MKLKAFLLLGIAAILAGCGHGYEGEYTEQAGSSNEVLNAVANAVGGKKVVIGSNFIDTDGQRTEFEDIFVRESGSDSYLVFKKDKDNEDVWKIVDKNTLAKGSDLASITLKRVEK
jgi:hypothetical protein